MSDTLVPPAPDTRPDPPVRMLVHVNHTNGDHESYEALRVSDRPNTLEIYCVSGEVIRVPVRNVRDWWTSQP